MASATDLRVPSGAGKPGYLLDRDPKDLPTVYNDIDFMGAAGGAHTFFKQTHFRHVPFSVQNMDIFDPFDFGTETVCMLPYHASFVSKMYLSFELPELPEGVYWVNSIGHKIIDNITVYIDSQKVQKITGEWLEIHNDLFTQAAHKAGVNQMIGKYETNIERKKAARSRSKSGKSGKSVCVPLNFWFCESLHQAIPLVSMRNSKLRLITKLKPLNELVEGGSVVESLHLHDTKFIADYIFIDDIERMKFVTRPMEYNIEQMEYEKLATLQAQIPVNPDNATITGGLFEFDLEWKGPVKYAVWTLRDNTTQNLISLRKAAITINGIDLLKRNKNSNSKIYQLMMPHAHNSNIPNTNLNVFSMCLMMSSDVPNGSSNVNNVSDLKFEVELMPNTNLSDLTMYNVRYNVLQFKDGVGRVMFS